MTFRFRLTYSPDGKTLASVGRKPDRYLSTIRLWSAETGEHIKALAELEIINANAAFSADEKIIATIAKFSRLVCFDIETNVKTLDMGYMTDFRGVSFFDQLFFSADGQRLAISHGYSILIFDAYSFEQLYELRRHQKEIWSLAYSPDSSLLASGDEGGTIILWDAYTGKKLKTIKGGKGEIMDMAFSPDGKTLASKTRYEKLLRLWNIEPYRQ